MTSRIKTSERAGGFTLIELILVMALLVIVIGVSAPSLSNFFRGRHLDSEARRLLSLTRYAQSRAVSEGMPMVVWLDERNGAYGMIAAGGYRDVDTNAVSFDLAPTLRLEVVEARADEVSLDPWSQTTRTLARMEEPTGRLLGADLAQIQFMPDGLISGSSPAHVLLWEGENTPRWLARSAERTRYEIQTNYTDYAIR